MIDTLTERAFLVHAVAFEVTWAIQETRPNDKEGIVPCVLAISETSITCRTEATHAFDVIEFTAGDVEGDTQIEKEMNAICVTEPVLAVYLTCTTTVLKVSVDTRNLSWCHDQKGMWITT